MSGGSALEVRGLSFTYRRASRAALRDVALDLESGRWGLLVGPTGAGKTTLVRCLNRSIPYFHPGDLSGVVKAGGEDTSMLRVPDMARRVGVVFQDFEVQLFSTTCLLELAFSMENRCLPPELIRSKASELLSLVGLSGFEARDPSTLSGGEKQRLVIASVLALETPVLVLDEPASDLDSGGREEIYRLIRHQRDSSPDRAVLLVEHDLEGLPMFEGGSLMMEGRIARCWEGGSDSTMVALASELEAAGVRPPPLAALAAQLQRVARAGPGEERQALPWRCLTFLDAGSLHGALAEAGWDLDPTKSLAPHRASARGPEVLRCESVTFVHPASGGGRRALDGVDLIIRQGEMLALIGSNGSGKTTLARHLAGLQLPTTGRVLLKGRDVGAIPARERVREIGFVFQNPDHQIFAATVAEEVAFGPRNLGMASSEVDRRVASALDVVGLTGSEGSDPFSMTKGERQRLALASVLACEPATIIMDEPTTGLDLNQQTAVMSLLERLNRRGHTILIITHALWLVHDPVDRVLVMIDGRIAADGTPGEVLTDDGLLARAGLRMPDLARLARLRGVHLLTLREWSSALKPPPRPWRS